MYRWMVVCLAVSLFAAVPWSPTKLYDVQVTTTPDVNVEGTIFTLQKNGLPNTAVAFMKLSGASYRTYVSHSTNLTASGGTFSTPLQIPLPSGHTDLVDPWLTGNPTGAGQRPGGVYLTALSGVRNNNRVESPAAIRAHYSDDGGATWSSGVNITSTVAGQSYYLDKPVSDVSLHSGTLGYLYVVWVEWPTTGTAHRIRLRRNVSGLTVRCRPVGGGCNTGWEAIATVEDGTAVAGARSPNVVVNPNNGNVYVFYRSLGANFAGPLVMRRSSDGGVSWSAPITVVSSIQNMGGTAHHEDGPFAGTVPMIRFNSVTNKIIATWNAAASSTTRTETNVFYATFDPDTISGPLAPQTITTDADSEIQPSLDHDDAGNVFISFYKLYRVDTSSGPLWEIALEGVSVTPAGAIGPRIQLSTRRDVDSIFLGDYHETHFFSGDGTPRFNVVWSELVNTQVHPVRVTAVQ